MIISVKVIPGTGKPEISGEYLVIHTKEKFEKGLANRDIISQVARFYGVNQSDVRIKSGFTSRKKILEVAGL